MGGFGSSGFKSRCKVFDHRLLTFHRLLQRRRRSFSMDFADNPLVADTSTYS